MMESVAGKDGPLVGEPARLICARCGAFTESVERVLQMSLCSACAARLRDRQQGLKLYPSGYLWVLGILGNGTIAAVLSALNWSRVDQPKRARTAWIVAGVCLVVSTVAAIASPRTSFMVTIASVVSTKAVLEGWKPLYEEHRRLGGRRASLLLPFAVILGVVIAAGVAYAVVMPDTEVE